MTVAIETAQSPYEAYRFADGAEFESALARSADPIEQLYLIRDTSFAYYREDKKDRAHITAGLARFAAESDPAVPAMIRLEALEKALELDYADDFNHLDPENYYQKMAAQDPDYGLINPKDQHVARGYRYAGQALVKAEELPEEPFFPEWTLDDIGRGKKWGDFNPVHAFKYLDLLEEGSKDIELQKFAPLITDIRQELAAAHDLAGTVDVPFSTWADIAVCQKLFSYGEYYSTALTELMNIDDAHKLEYVQAIGEIYAGIDDAAAVFPKRYEEGVRKGMQNLLADAAYAVRQHVLTGGYTKVVLPLKNSNGELPLELTGDEPLQLLRTFGRALSIMGNVHRNANRWRQPVNHAIQTTDSDQFRLYRFRKTEYVPPHDHRGIDDEDPFVDSVKPVTLYVRPYGSVSYDPNLEYGRPGEGVEASISFVIDMATNTDRLIEVGKHRDPANDQRISIRLDREGVKPADRMTEAKRDPTRKEGTLSLDVGSVLGKDEWASTKLGRFLAWGNYLRTQQQGSETHLNHVTDYFTDEDGDADVFAFEAARMIEALDARKMKVEEIRGLFAGRVAVGGARQ